MNEDSNLAFRFYIAFYLNLIICFIHVKLYNLLQLFNA